MTTALKARELFYIYRAAHGDVAALRGLSVDVAAREVVSVVGPSGAGKSTLLAIAAGWLRPSSGEVSVLGVDAGRPGDVRRVGRSSIGIVRQHYHRSLPREFRIEEIVALPLRLLGHGERVARARARELLGKAGLGRRADARLDELSGGEQQRVALCAALAKRPRLLLADEPTGELDARASRTIVELLLALADDADASALIVTHDDEVASRTPRTIHIRDGRLAAEGTTDPVLIIDEQGWVRLPESLRATGGFGERARASATWGRIELVAEDADELPLAARDDDGLTAAVVAAAPHEVELRQVAKAFRGEAVLERMTASFAPGALHVVAGPSGSGKTTLLNLIAGLDRPDAGEVVVGPDRVDALDADAAAMWRQRTIGYVSQHSTLVDFLSAVENVELALLLRGWSNAESRARASHWLGWVGLAHLEDRRADRLSGGEQRRVALARALAPLPSVLVADEPTAHLDRVSGRLVIRRLRWAASLDMTVIAATHDPDLIAAADRTLELAAVRGT